MERPCKFCDNGQMVNMEKPEGSEKWIVTNLDGSFHKHVKSGPEPYPPIPRQQQTLQHQTGSNALEIRNEIKQAHDEKMEAYEKICSKLQALTDQLVNLEKVISVYVYGQREEGGE